ncbi:hypothetical protein CAI16_05150 [Virgibacillus dokdonensis]|uniref:Carrier domain-containing protein n=1 Tax=Virgibacillus dokdonensis TaxID=302167 RepID=A0A3E0WVG7_9BACI|nr:MULTISPECIES: hypothetical protein [Virgibacillus]RFA36183.1 hypothetical protein CAI16_05150 [Virgibacillus dokdonensis]
MIDKGLIESKLKEIFENQGTYINEEDYNDEILLDSLQLINIVIEMEEMFLIRITDDFLGFNNMKTFTDFYYCVVNYLEGKE